MSNADIDALIGQTVPRPRPARPPKSPNRTPLGLLFKEWAKKQVAAYRIGLVVGYIAMIYFGSSSAIAGIPTFLFTTPDPEAWTPVWGTLVSIGGFIAAVGATRAGSEPVTKSVKVFNGIELTGSVVLFVTLSCYAIILLVLGYGFGNAPRASIGAGFVALGIQPAVRMVWLFFRRNLPSDVPVYLPPEGYALFKVDEEGNPIVKVEKPLSGPVEVIHQTGTRGL